MRGPANWQGQGDHEGSGDGGGDDGMTTYADAITLLLAFFVLLFSFAEIDRQAYESLKAAIAIDFGSRTQPDPPAPAPALIPKPGLQGTADKLQKLSAKTDTKGDFQVRSTEDGVEIELAGRLMFALGSTSLREDSKGVLDDVLDAVVPAMDESYEIEVEGHTDDNPVGGGRFRNNWGLSAARAVTVVEYLVSKGVAKEQVRASGLADTRPKLPNRTEAGVAIPENQAANRRVVIRVKKKKETNPDILDLR